MTDPLHRVVDLLRPLPAAGIPTFVEPYGAAGNELFVTCGIGFSVIPVRISAPPQLLLVELARPG